MECIYCKKKLEIKGLKNHLRKCYKKNEHNKENFEDIYWQHFFLVEEINDIVEKYLIDFLCIEDIAKIYNKDRFFIKRLLIYKNINLRSNSESKKTKTYINKYKTTIQDRYGVDNVSKNKEIKEKKKQTFLKNFNYENNFCNPIINKKAHDNINHEECNKKHKITIKKRYNAECLNDIPGVLLKTKNTMMQKYGVFYTTQNEVLLKKMMKTHIATLKERYGVDNITDIPGVLEKRNKSIKDSIKNRDFFKNPDLYWKDRKFVSKLELEVQKILNDLQITYFNNIWIKGKNVDLYIPSKNLIIEINGDYWHANPLSYKENDKILKNKDGSYKTAKEIWERDSKNKIMLLKEGYSHLTIWEYDLKKNKKQLANYILNILINKEYEN